jgi:hypothetical protein
VHYSPPNTSGKIRKAITAGVKTKDAQMIFHYKDATRTDNMIEKFEMDDDFFIQFENFFEDIFKRPTVGKSTGFIEYEVPMLKGEKLALLIKEMKIKAGFEYKESPKQLEEIHQDELQEEVIAEDKPAFWEVYTPINIAREIKYRLTGK